MLKLSIEIEGLITGKKSWEQEHTSTVLYLRKIQNESINGYKQDYSLVGEDGEGFMDLERVETRELAALPKVWEDFLKEAEFFKVFAIVVIWEISYPLLLCFLPFLLKDSVTVFYVTLRLEQI